MIVELTPFPRRPIPIPGETVYSFERRFASCAKYERLDAFRRATGLKGFGSTSCPEKWERLAALAGLDPAELECLRWRVPKTKHRLKLVTILGQTVFALHLSHISIRFCPQCLAEAPGPEQRTLRQTWQIQLVTACPRHNTLLVDSCDRCGEQFDHYRKTGPWTCVCGQEMSDIKTVTAPEGAVAMSLAFMRYFGMGVATGRLLDDDRGRLPELFCDLPLGDLLALAVKIGTLAATPACDDEPIGANERVNRSAIIEPDLPILKAAQMMDAACHVFARWPASADLLFASLADRNPEPAVAHPVRQIFGTRMGYLLLGELDAVDGSSIRVLQDALEDWQFRERGIYVGGQRRARAGHNGDAVIDVADAARRLEGRPVDATYIRAWHQAGAISLLGKKVLLSSVERTASILAQLPDHAFEDAMSIHEWGRVARFSHKYRRAAVLADVLSGKIRVQRDPGEHHSGLAALRLCRADFCKRLDVAASGLPLRRKPTAGGIPLTDAELKRRRLERRIANLRRIDGFLQEHKIHLLLSTMWPDAKALKPLSENGVRCKYVVRHYQARDFGMRLYSVIDALNIMSKRHGSFE